MSRDEGFEVMDVSTSILHDPKFGRLAREKPEQAGDGFTAYMSTVAESWKAGQRLSIEDAWPAILPFDRAIVDALKAVKLLDPKGRVTASAWRGYFNQARNRRELSRERWRRANLKREQEAANPSTKHRADTRAGRDVTAMSPRGSSADTQANDSDSVPSDSETVEETRVIPPPPAERGRRKDGTNPRTTGDAPRQTGENARANGTSPRQEREGAKRAPTMLGQVLRESVRRQPETPSWMAEPTEGSST